jgi:hypothetical protein
VLVSDLSDYIYIGWIGIIFQFALTIHDNVCYIAGKGKEGNAVI